MKERFLWLSFLGLALFLVALPLAPTLAGEAEWSNRWVQDARRW
jgi:hypothetical protein